MSIEIKVVKTEKERRTFVKFPELLYRNNPYYVPTLVFDDMDTLDPEENPAFKYCDCELYLAYKDGKLAGRIAAIVNFEANRTWGHNQVRFGWFDFIDDKEVSTALMDKVVEYGKMRGSDAVVGPLGFVDMDPEGMLVEGYDCMSTMPTIYNFPYYKEHMDAMGFEKEVDWLEYKLAIPEEMPEKLARVEKLVMERNPDVKVVDVTRKLVREKDYGHKIMDLINETYKDLYNYTVLPKEMADKVLGFYLSILDLRYISCVENGNGELIGFAITMPSLAKALQKSRGELFPFGWYHLAKAMWFKHSYGAELLLIGVRPDYKNQGINGLLMSDIFRKFKKLGVKWAETNCNLEDNIKVQQQWAYFEYEQNKRRRSFIKHI